jgi:Restriction endonuclease
MSAVKKPTPNWLDFEKLIARIYSQLQPDAVVEHDDHIVGRSGVRRQIDVSIRTTVAGQALLTIVSAKDWARPVDIGDLDGFAGMVEDVGANNGVMICRQGFTNGAKRSAKRRGFDLCQAHDAMSRRWRLDAITIPILWRTLKPDAHFKITFDNGHRDVLMPASPLDWLIRWKECSAGMKEGVRIGERWNARAFVPPDSGTTVHFDRRIGMEIQDAKGDWHKVDSLTMHLNRQVKTYLGHVDPAECQGLKYEDGRFVASYIPESSRPRHRDPNWPEVNLNELAIRNGKLLQGTVMLAFQYRVDPAKALTYNVSGRSW